MRELLSSAVDVARSRPRLLALVVVLLWAPAYVLAVAPEMRKGPLGTIAGYVLFVAI